MAYQSEIELRVKIADRELRELERRTEQLVNRFASGVNPFGASGGRKLTAAQRREEANVQRQRLNFVKDAVEAEDRLRNTKAQKTLETNLRRVRYLRDQRIKAARDVAKAEKTLAADNARFRENLALGAGFPLLFGGGIGAVGGGVLGAVAGRGGGGFGLQILFSALGQQVDAFFSGVSEAATTVASSLGGTTETLDALGEAGIKVEQSLIDQVQSLEDAGRAVAAYDAVQKELTATYGERGLQALQTLKSANESAAESTSELNAVLQAELAPTFTLISDVSSGAAVALAKLVPVLNLLLNPFKGTPDPERARQVARQGRIDAGVRQRAAQIETGQTVDQLSGDVSSLQRQTEIAKLNNDLTNDRVVLLKEIEIITKATSQIDALDRQIYEDKNNEALKEVNLAKIKKIEAQQALDLAQLEVDARNAVTRAVEKTTREQERATAAQERAAKAAERAAEKAERARMKELQDRIDIAARERQKELDLEASFQKRTTGIGNEIALLRGQIDGNEELVRKQIEINGLVAQFGEEKRGQIELLVNEKFELAEQNRLLQEQKQIFGQIGQTIETGVVDLIEAAVDRTKSLGEVASGILRNLARQFLSLGVNQLFGAFNFGGGGGGGLNLAGIDAYMANGGSARAGGSYIVGERGPELFVPRTSGTVVPNSSLGGSASVTVNVDASGSSVEGDANQAGRLGKAIGIAVQQELIKQKRPGGLLGV